MTERRRYLEFEQDLAALDEQIKKLKGLKMNQNVDITTEIRTLEEKSNEILKSVCEALTPHQQVQLSRHPDRPTCLDYIGMLFEDFVELSGDRCFGEDASLVAGLARFEGQSVLVMGHQKGRNTNENLKRNFGMARPEAYRKALRLMEMAERWKLPIFTFVDTPGAYPGLDAEERGQSEAIAHNVLRMSNLKVPIITTIIGEGGSGGALAIAICDRLLMLEYTIYSVISPEGCASITWKDAKFAADAAKALQVTARSIHERSFCDQIVKEPLGGAHREPIQAAASLKTILQAELKALQKLKVSELLDLRYEKYRQISSFKVDESLTQQSRA